MSEFEKQFFPQGPKSPLLQAAAQRMVSGGLYKFTLAEVAKQAQVSRPHLNYHYPSIDPLLIDLAQVWARSGQSVTTKTLEEALGDEPDSLILKIVDATFLWHQQCPTLSRLTPLLIHLASTSPALAKIMDVVTQQGRQRMQEILCKKGLSKRDSDQQAMSLHLQLIGGFLYCLGTSAETSKKVQQSIKTSMQLWLAQSNTTVRK